MILPAEHFAQAARPRKASMFTFGSNELAPACKVLSPGAMTPNRLERVSLLPIQ